MPKWTYGNNDKFGCTVKHQLTTEQAALQSRQEDPSGVPFELTAVGHLGLASPRRDSLNDGSMHPS